jgi:hypothetical protein
MRIREKGGRARGRCVPQCVVSVCLPWSICMSDRTQRERERERERERLGNLNLNLKH